MAEPRADESLQPALLARLTDENPHRATETRDEGIVRTERFRQLVRDDLTSLFNSHGIESSLRAAARYRTDPPASLEDVEAPLARYPNVATSVLNYGMPEWIGQTIGGKVNPGAGAEGLADTIRSRIELYEPRLRRGGLRVTLQHVGRADRGVQVSIEGELLARPLPEPLQLMTRLDTGTGDTVVETVRGA